MIDSSTVWQWTHTHTHTKLLRFGKNQAQSLDILPTIIFPMGAGVSMGTDGAPLTEDKCSLLFQWCKSLLILTILRPVLAVGMCSTTAMKSYMHYDQNLAKLGIAMGLISESVNQFPQHQSQHTNRHTNTLTWSCSAWLCTCRAASPVICPGTAMEGCWDHYRKHSHLHIKWENPSRWHTSTDTHIITCNTHTCKLIHTHLQLINTSSCLSDIEWPFI